MAEPMIPAPHITTLWAHSQSQCCGASRPFAARQRWHTAEVPLLLKLLALQTQPAVSKDEQRVYVEFDNRASTLCNVMQQCMHIHARNESLA